MSEEQFRSLQAGLNATNTTLSAINARVRRLEAAEPTVENEWPVVILIGLMLLSVTIVVLGLGWMVFGD